jgi:hypothetical protein
MISHSSDALAFQVSAANDFNQGHPGSSHVCTLGARNSPTFSTEAIFARPAFKLRTR